MQDEKTQLEDHHCREWGAKCLPQDKWQEDPLTHYGPEGLIFPKSFEKWTHFIRNMTIRPDDTWILTFPKCGTTWAQEMLWLLANDLDFKKAKDLYIEQRFPMLEIDAMKHLLYLHQHHYKEESLTSMELIDQMPTSSPRFIKSHMPLSLLPQNLLQVGAKIVFITRNPKDVCLSYFHFSVYAVGYRGTLEEFAESFMTDEAVMWAPFWRRLKTFHDMHSQNQPNLLFLTYEQMKNDLRGVLTKTRKFLNKPQLTLQELEALGKHLSFEEMKNNPKVNKEGKVKVDKTPFMRKGQVGSWKQEMSPELAHKFDEWMDKNKIEGLF